MVLIAVFIPASQMHSVLQAFDRVALDAWSCLFFFLWGGKETHPQHCLSGTTGQNQD